jgi:DNA invertase Pin-like site-specific DNA recombinase
MAMGKLFVAYYRVSTERQGRSGLGVDAQKAAVDAFIREGDRKLIDSFEETETGKNNDRPVLAKAMDVVRLTGATLLIAKLDRLSRDASFLLNLEKSEVDFVAVDMPHANRMTIGIMAVMADCERRMISERTKAAMDAARARGVKFGGWRNAGPPIDQPLGPAAIKANADKRALKVGPIVEKLQGDGYSCSQIAVKLTERHAKTARGGEWSAQSVHTLLNRYKRLVPPADNVPTPPKRKPINAGAVL